MTHRRVVVAIFVLLATCSLASAQELVDAPIRLEVGGFPGGGTFFVGGDDNTEVDFNVYTFGGYVDYYVTQKIAVEADYTFGVGMGQDLFFRNGLIPGQQVPYSNSFGGNLMFFPQGTSGARFPYYVGGGVGLLRLISRDPTVKLGYDPEVVSSESFTMTQIGGGIKLPRGASAPNWSFRFDYRLLFIGSNSDAPAFFAKSKSRTGHHIQFGMQYAFRR